MGKLDKNSYSIKQYFDEKFKAENEFFNIRHDALANLMDTKFKNLDRATSEARISMDKRLDGMNEFRETLKDQAGQFLTIKEFNSQNEKIVGDIRILRESRAELEGKASQESVEKLRNYATLSMIVTIVSVCIALGSVVASIILNN